ncbi:MAG TPA: type I restriction endonuclease [Chloroflexota bacterium]|nr:type I restriction endonuclease [Chloroflexota bacterium]
MITNTRERRIERAVLDAMTGKTVIAPKGKSAGSGGWMIAETADYDRALAMDPGQLTAFLEKTQLASLSEEDRLDLQVGSPKRQAFLTLLQGEVSSRGVIDVLRRGVNDGSVHRDLFFGMRSPSIPGLGRRFTQNRFSLIPRLKYSQDDTCSPVDLCLFINGLPIATMELADGLTKQSVDDAIDTYKGIDASEEPLFQSGRCMAHFAVDEEQVFVCSELRGDKSDFRPFNQGASDAAANPANLFGIATDYLWRQILTRPGVIDLIENFAQSMHVGDEHAEAASRVPVFPRYHQLEVVRRLVIDAEQHSVGYRYLIQHAPGTGSSYSIGWLVNQLIGLQQDSIRIFDSTFVVTDRPSIERRLKDTVRGFSRISGRLGEETRASARLHQCIDGGMSIIIASVEQLPLVLDEVDASQRGRRFAFIIDETPPVGSTGAVAEELVNRAMQGRERLPNASTFVFAPTANDTTLQLFGQPFNDRGQIRYRPFHQYGAS